MGVLGLIKKVKQHTLQTKIVNMFYADYPERPYISNDRKSDWIQKAETFPKTMVVQKSMMKRYSDGLLPGHVYMLYWLKKYTNKAIPSYFEYKYGIDFEKEKEFLRNNGFLDNTDKPTAKGETAIMKHSKVIENHNPKQDLSIEGISIAIRKQRDSIRRNGFKGFTFIANRDCCPVCAALNGKHFMLSDFKVGVNAPPMHEGCKCSIAAYEDDAEYQAWISRF